MGYEIAGGLGAKMARRERDVHVMVGDGSYLMLNSEIATSVMLGQKLIITCSTIAASAASTACNRGPAGAVQQPAGRRAHETCRHRLRRPCREPGRALREGGGVAELEAALARARASDRTYVIVIDTDPAVSTEAGGAWWDVAVPEVSARPEVRAARAAYESAIKDQRIGD
jgi:3D-(3,5/4)-trihydroxycyclohexane-1,2-dione acylhydrolase (decyclizing)